MHQMHQRTMHNILSLWFLKRKKEHNFYKLIKKLEDIILIKKYSVIRELFLKSEFYSERNCIGYINSKFIFKMKKRTYKLRLIYSLKKEKKSNVKLNKN